MAVRVVQAVRELALPHPQSTVSNVVSVSVGAHSAMPNNSDPHATPDKWVAAADKALYRAKAAGPDRVELA